MCQRIKALGAKKWFVKDNPKATGYTADDIQKMSVSVLSKKYCRLHAKLTWDQSEQNAAAQDHLGNGAADRD